MAGLFRFVKSITTIQLPVQNRNVSLSATSYLKEIIEKREGNTITYEGIIKPDENDKRFLKPKGNACPVCSSGLDIKHTDVLILSQFVRSNGNMLPRRITGLCKVQQKRITTMVVMAQKAGLMPNLAPRNSKNDPTRRYQWKKYNTYYDEETIKQRYWLN
ncbi:mitochondrial ribosomal protein S18A [Nomia melanderi]|uniref:mitochondrial ribosomal protein S18A n=1 Tax=Nomia melanderi TaxID=2448451 RepID=UPI001304367D|nr:39S ribosomal protein S18a, mitochondrial [Nomia melanderi]